MRYRWWWLWVKVSILLTIFYLIKMINMKETVNSGDCGGDGGGGGGGGGGD